MAAASVLALSPLSLAACGGSTDEAAVDSAATGDVAAADQMEAFQECMADQGVEMGAPPSQDGTSADAPASMPDQDTMAAAQEACADLAPEGMGQGGPGMGQGGGEELQAYTECLADNGVEVDAGSSGGPPTGEPPTGEPPTGGAEAGQLPGGTAGMLGLDESDPEVAAALEACSDLEPQMPSGAPPGAVDGTVADGAESS